MIVNAALIGVWAITGAGYFWPGWVLGAWGIGLLFHAWATFGQKPIREEETGARRTGSAGSRKLTTDRIAVPRALRSASGMMLRP